MRIETSWFSPTTVLIPKLDIHFTNLCNLHCDQCTHLSNFNINKKITIEELKNYYELWNKKIQPIVFAISGGEPFLHKDVEKMICLTKKSWPHSQILIFSNGLLLHKFTNLPLILKKHGITLIVSNHSTTNSAKYDKKFNDVVNLLKGWIKKYDIPNLIEIDGYLPDHDTTIYRKENNELVEYKFINETSSWLKFYKGYGKEMKPYNDNNVKESWNNCPVGQTCFQLYNGNIYKCAPLAYLPDLHNKFGLSPEWDHYLSYKPLSPDSSLKELKKFFAKKEESYCNMCPSTPQKFVPSNNPMKIFDLKLIS